MRRLISMLVLVAVLGGLGAYIYFVESKRPAGGAIDAKEKVFTVESDKIEEITLTAENETSTVKKVDGTWRMTAPVQADADQTEISNVSNNLSTLEVNRVVEENAANLDQYGLATPRIAIAFKAQGGVSGQLHLGDKTATQSDIYAVKPGEKRVFLVPGYHDTTFAKKSFDLRDKRILNFERDKVDSIEIAQGDSVVVLARSGSSWVVKQPVPTRGDYSAIEGLLTRIASGSMTKLVESAPSGASAPADPSTLTKYGLDKPEVRVTLGAGSARATLAVGKEEEGAVYARDQARGIVFTVDPALATDLKKPADEYRNKDVFEFRSFNLARIRITRGTETHEFQKVAGTGEGASDKWQRVVAGGAATDVDSAKIDDLLGKLTALRAQSFVSGKEAALVDNPAIVVSASYDEGKFERVRLAKATDALAAREGEPGAAKLDTTAYDDMIKSLDALLAPPAPAK